MPGTYRSQMHCSKVIRGLSANVARLCNMASREGGEMIGKSSQCLRAFYVLQI